MKKVHTLNMTINFGGFRVSDMKWRGSYRQSCWTYYSEKIWHGFNLAQLDFFKKLTQI